MAKVKCIDLTRIPVVREGFYATNNQFQKAGPKGFIQVKVLENDNLYVRVDLPGVPDDAVRYRIDGVRQKVVFFSGETLGDVNEKDGVREYSGTAGLGCNCCEITNVNAKMKDGVLRMILSRVKVNKDNQNKCTLTLPPFTGQSGRHVEDHPYVVKGRKGAFFAGSAVNGGAYFTMDIPGVFKDDVEVLANESEIRFTAEIKNVFEHDESGRIYLGSIEMPSVLSHTISCNADFGVLKILLTPPRNNNNNEGSLINSLSLSTTIFSFWDTLHYLAFLCSSFGDNCVRVSSPAFVFAMQSNDSCHLFSYSQLLSLKLIETYWLCLLKTP